VGLSHGPASRCPLVAGFGGRSQYQLDVEDAESVQQGHFQPPLSWDVGTTARKPRGTVRSRKDRGKGETSASAITMESAALS